MTKHKAEVICEWVDDKYASRYTKLINKWIMIKEASVTNFKLISITLTPNGGLIGVYSYYEIDDV